MKKMKICLITVFIILIILIILKLTIFNRPSSEEFDISNDEEYIPTEEEIKELEEGYGEDIIITPNENIERYDS